MNVPKRVSTKYDGLLLATFGLFIIGFIAAGYVYLTNFKSEYEAGVARRLSTVSELKSDEVVLWRKNLTDDANFFYNNNEFASQVKKYFLHPTDVQAENQIKLLMTKVYSAYDYDAVFLLDKNYITRLAIYDGPKRSLTFVSQESKDSIHAGRVVFEDLYVNRSDGKNYLKLLVPIADGKTKAVIAIIALRIDPDRYLYPFLQRWPSDSKSGETYIIRKDDGAIRYLTPLRFKRTDSLAASGVSATDPQLLVMQATIRPDDIIEGIDYRGRDVIAKTQKIPESPWIIVTQMDRSEIYASYQERQWTILLSMIFFLISAGTTFGLAVKHNSVKTLRLQLESAKALHDSEENLSITLNSIGDGVISTDVAGRITHMNPRAEQLCGWSLAESTGKPLLVVFNIVDAVTRKACIDPVTRVLEAGGVIGLENHTVLLAKDGTVHQIADSAAPIKDNDGKIFGVVLVFSDVTEKYQIEDALRESESRYKMLADNSFDVIWTMDLNGKFMYISPSVVQLRGYTPEEIIGQSFEEVISPGSRQLVLEKIRNQLQSAKNGEQASVETIEVEQPCKDGTSVWTEIVTRIMTDEFGKALGVIGISRNIQERKRTEQALRHAQRMESIGVLAGGIAHDFNNLLGTMMGNVSLAQSHLPEHHPAIKNIEKTLMAIDRAAELTKQMLAYSGKGKYQITSIDLGALVQEHVSLFEVSLPKNVTLVTYLPSTPVYVNGDPGQIEQIIMNLIINGGEALGTKQGEVTIRLRAVSMWSDELFQYGRITNTTLSEGMYAQLEVSECGVGMSGETMNKIFDPFFTTKFTGRGLGLSAVLGIIKGHRGGITVVSKEGAGTTFRVILPIGAGPTVEAVVPSDEGIEFPQSPAAVKTVLVIDDEVDVATTAGEILQAGNYATMIELNPVRGVELYKEHVSEIGAVLLDLTMPAMSGKEVVVALQAINPSVKIIISSGYSEDEMLKKMGVSKVSGFLQKPYRVQELLSIVHGLMHDNVKRRG